MMKRVVNEENHYVMLKNNKINNYANTRNQKRIFRKIF